MKNYCDSGKLTELILKYKRNKHNNKITLLLYNELKKIVTGVIFGTKLRYHYNQDFSLKEVVELTLSHLFTNMDFYDTTKNSFTYFSVVSKRYLNRLIYSKFTDNTNSEKYIKGIKENTIIEEGSTNDIDESILYNSILKLIKLELDKYEKEQVNLQNYYTYQRSLALSNVFRLLLKTNSYSDFLVQLDKMTVTYKDKIYKIIKGIL